MTGRGRGDQQWAKMHFRHPTDMPHSEDWEYILAISQVGRPAPASPVNGPRFSNRPEEKVWADDMEKRSRILPSCPNRLGTAVDR